MSGGATQSVAVCNRKLAHDFFIGKVFEAGIVLKGPEIKSIRSGAAILDGSFIHLDRYGRPVWINAHIGPYAFDTEGSFNPTRSRFLLLHKKEIDELRGAVERKGESIFPVKLYFAHGLAKLQIAICKAKKLHDKRQDLKKRVEEREMARSVRSRRTR